MTNGGGVTEARKAEELATWLDVDVGEDQVSSLPAACTIACLY